jgi:hypothetical protein
MALARIITRSQACSRELALDLLARGYAVEIVSPDRVPDNIADLELRVDTAPGDRLIANVEAHDGERSASLEFVHHLRAPMGDFMRRTPAPLEAVHFRQQPVRSNAEPVIEDVELPADAPQPAVKKVSPAAEIPLHRDLDPSPEEGARPIVPQVPSPPAVKPPGYFAVEDAAMTQATMVSPVPVIVPPREATPRRDRSAGWRLRATLIFVGMVLLAVVLAFGIRRAGKATEQNSGTLSVDKIAAASADVNPLYVNPLDTNPLGVNPMTVGDSGTDPVGPGNVSGSALPPAAVNSAGISGHAPEKVQIAKVAGPAASPQAGVSRKDGHDFIARDTVIYLDKRFEPAPKAKQATALARRHPKPRPHSGGVIAANSVTYLNKPAPKAGK